ncbi:MAG: hypothetical protein M0Z67_15430 [Nitrospiraceae bacterium]|nr:hypothetical protein [Nitrospiraceae bacterium]
MKTLDMIISILTIFGALEVSYVESVILSLPGGETDQRKSLREMYWHDLSWKNRWLFWTGVICMLSPFLIPVFATA